MFIISCFFCRGEDLNFKQKMDIITGFEKSGDWRNALPIYRELHSKLSRSMDGLTMPFVFRKGICELQCSQFSDAEKSFRFVAQAEDTEDLAEIHKPIVARSMFYIAEAQALNGKFDDAQKSLIEANRVFNIIYGIDNDSGLADWRKSIVQKISRSIEIGKRK